MKNPDGAFQGRRLRHTGRTPIEDNASYMNGSPFNQGIQKFCGQLHRIDILLHQDNPLFSIRQTVQKKYRLSLLPSITGPRNRRLGRLPEQN